MIEIVKYNDDDLKDSEIDEVKFVNILFYHLCLCVL